MKKNVASRLVHGLTAILLLVAVDQVTKLLAKTHLAGTAGIPVISGVFELFYLENRGAAFGMLANRQWFFILIAILMFTVAVYVLLRIPERKYYFPLRAVCILIASGAVGNMLDRLIWNYVIDFLYVSLIDFPVFNIADCYVCIGAVAAVLLLFTVYKEESFEFLMPKVSHDK